MRELMRMGMFVAGLIGVSFALTFLLYFGSMFLLNAQSPLVFVLLLFALGISVLLFMFLVFPLLWSLSEKVSNEQKIDDTEDHRYKKLLSKVVLGFVVLLVFLYLDEIVRFVQHTLGGGS